MSEWALADTFPPIQLYITLAMAMTLLGVIEKEPVIIEKGGYAVIVLAFFAAISVVASSGAAAMKTTSYQESIYLVANAVVITGLFWVMAWWLYKKVTERQRPPTPS